MLKLICALALTWLLCACSPNVPTAKRGAVDFYHDGQMTSSRVLEEKEARAVSGWFKTNGSGWSRSHVSDAPTTIIRLRHSDRETTMINLSGNTVIVTNSGGQFRKTLSREEAVNLRAIAGIPPVAGP
jgi:hypothetical protein